MLLGHSEYDEDHLKLTPVTTQEYGESKAKRPFNSRLDKRKLTENGFRALPDWQDALGAGSWEMRSGRMTSMEGNRIPEESWEQ